MASNKFYDSAKRSFISWFADIRFYKGGIILFGDSHYKIKGSETRLILNKLKPGDVLLRRYNNYLGSVLVPGYWSHAALYTGNDTVIHMLGEGITEEDIFSFLRCDDVAILRVDDVDLVEQAIITAYSLLKQEIDYDYDFSTKNKTLYCSEFIYMSYNKPEIKNQKMSKYILPDDLLNTIFCQVDWNTK